MAEGYQVHAQTRALQRTFANDALVWHTGELADFGFVERLISDIAPDEVYNLAAMSRPAKSWELAQETTVLNGMLPQQLCTILVKRHPQCRLFQASSSEMFGDAPDENQNENTCCRPKNPYGASKAYAHHILAAYRAEYGLHASSGILFNHESPRRPLGFVSQKIAHAAAAISLGISTTVETDERDRPIVDKGIVRLGNIEARRDFCFAGDVARAMRAMVASETPGDYVIGSGKNHSISEFCQLAFGLLGLDWRQHVEVDNTLVRSSDIRATRADTTKIQEQLGWKPEVNFEQLVAMMVEDRVKMLKLSYAR